MKSEYINQSYGVLLLKRADQYIVHNTHTDTKESFDKRSLAKARQAQIEAAYDTSMDEIPVVAIPEDLQEFKTYRNGHEPFEMLDEQPDIELGLVVVLKNTENETHILILPRTREIYSFPNQEAALDRCRLYLKFLSGHPDIYRY